MSVRARAALPPDARRGGRRPRHRRRREPGGAPGTGLLARCLQHETDHLDGILYVDRLDGEERREARRRMRAGEVDRAARRIGAARAAAVSSVFGAPAVPAAGTGAAR
nr:peptide deformylase [Micrococcus luteus]